MTTDPTDPWDRALRAAMGPARELEPTDAEVQRALARDRTRSTQHHRSTFKFATAAIGAAVILASGTYAVPSTRAAVGDLYGSMTDWFSGSEAAAPGRPLEAQDDAPSWVTATGGDRRLVAENGGVKMFAVRTGEDLTIGIGNSYSQTATPEQWREQLEDRQLVMLGTGSFPGVGPLDAKGRRPLFGLVSKSVVRVELRYTTGSPSSQSNLDGGFVVLADAHRKPEELVGYNAGGRQVDQLDVSSLELRVCFDVRGCPPGTYQPAITG